MEAVPSSREDLSALEFAFPMMTVFRLPSRTEKDDAVNKKDERTMEIDDAVSVNTLGNIDRSGGRKAGETAGEEIRSRVDVTV
mmetsp:Transcript_27653/g.59128  ORF Transcript_27653/g.59128 Transcript_27653/m.59128 type:complete len:83 (-) Transcript_27653:20-268(-)